MDEADASGADPARRRHVVMEIGDFTPMETSTPVMSADNSVATTPRRSPPPRAGLEESQVAPTAHPNPRLGSRSAGTHPSQLSPLFVETADMACHGPRDGPLRSR